MTSAKDLQDLAKAAINAKAHPDSKWPRWFRDRCDPDTILALLTHAGVRIPEAIEEVA